jgi:hypothetical protein
MIVFHGVWPSTAVSSDFALFSLKPGTAAHQQRRHKYHVFGVSKNKQMHLYLARN